MLLFNNAQSSPNNIRIIDEIKLDYEQIDSSAHCFVPHQSLVRPKVGLVLSGGGLRGIAQIGVLKALEENNIPIDYIVGASIGALVAGLYASGYTADELWEIAQSIDWSAVFDDTPNRSSLFLAEKMETNRAIIQFRLNRFKPSIPEALTPGIKLTDLLTKLTINAPYHSTDFSKFPIPLLIIATDLNSGNKVRLTNGDLTEAIRASIAIPLLLTPVEIDSMMLIDGGVLDNIPVEEARQIGADIVIAVDTTSPLRSPENMSMPWEVLDQVTTIMQQEQKKAQLAQADYIVDISDVPGTSTGLDNLILFFEKGYNRAQNHIENLIAQIDKSQKVQDKTYFIHQIEYKNLQNDTLQQLTSIRPNSNVSTQEIYNALKNLYKSGLYDSVFARIVEQNDQFNLVINASPQLKIDKVSFKGNRILSDSLLSSITAPYINRPLSYGLSNSIQYRILKEYRNNGFSLAMIKNIHCDANTLEATIEIDEGNIGNLNIAGNRRTKEFVIRREFHVNQGSEFQLSQMNEGLSNLHATGLFKSIILKTDQQDNNWNLNLHLQEKLPHVIRLGARYNRERNGRSFIEFSDENFAGTGNDFTIHGQYGDRDADGKIKYRLNRIFKTLYTSEIDFHSNKSKFFAYENFDGVGEYERRSTGSIISMGRHIERFGAISFFTRNERIYIRSISGYGYDTGKMNINTIGFTTIVDTRDQVPFPKSGRYFDFSYEVSGGEFLSADISYFKVQNQLASYLTFFKRNTICPKIFWGTSDLTTPYSEQFRIGGQNSFMGLREGEMQGRHAVLASLEYRYFFPSKLLFDTFLTLRYDVGSAWKNSLEIKGEDFISGRGVAFAFDTPLGPISFAYGVASNGKKTLYFNAGYEF